MVFVPKILGIFKIKNSDLRSTGRAFRDLVQNTAYITGPTPEIIATCSCGSTIVGIFESSLNARRVVGWVPSLQVDNTQRSGFGGDQFILNDSLL